MKLLLDPIYTGKPSTCSTSYLFWEIIDRLVAERDDVFFYLIVPSHCMDDEEEVKFLSRHPGRVKLFPMQMKKGDRVWELFGFNQDLHAAVATLGDAWDADVMITSRIPQMMNFRTNAGRQDGPDKGLYRMLIGIDEMPFFSFRDTVPWTRRGRMDLSSLANYQQASAIIMQNLWSKTEVLQIAREWLAPSKVREMGPMIHEAVPVKLGRLTFKETLPKKGGELNCVFTGRTTGTRNFKEVAELFRKQFAYAVNKPKVNFTISTNSLGTGSVDYGEIDFIEVQRNTRDDFYKFLKTEAHVAINLSSVEDFSLSTYEPLLYGVPVIVDDKPWSAFLGPDYPFRVKSFVEAYAMVNDFAKNYAKQYEKFKDWEANYWASFIETDRNTETSAIVSRLVAQHDAVLQTVVDGGNGGSFITTADAITASPETALEIVAYCDEYKFINRPKNYDGVPVTRRVSLALLKILLRARGWKDSLEVGVITREPAP